MRSVSSLGVFLLHSHEFDLRLRAKRKRKKRRYIDLAMQKYLKENLGLYYFYITHSLFDSSDIFHFNMQQNAFRIYNAYHDRKTNCKKKLNRLFISYPNNCFFLTLTFKDEFLNVKQKDLTILFKDYLYILNEDFGDEFNRRHYHMVFVSPYNSLKKTYNLIFDIWVYGFIYVEKINCGSNLGLKFLSRYLTKLSAHAVKGSTGKKIIYHLKKG